VPYRIYWSATPLHSSVMDESFALEASSVEEEVAEEHVEETHDEDGEGKAPSSNECCIRIAGSVKGICHTFQ